MGTLGSYSYRGHTIWCAHPSSGGPFSAVDDVNNGPRFYEDCKSVLGGAPQAEAYINQLLSKPTISYIKYIGQVGDEHKFEVVLSGSGSGQFCISVDGTIINCQVGGPGTYYWLLHLSPGQHTVCAEMV